MKVDLIGVCDWVSSSCWYSENSPCQQDVEWFVKLSTPWGYISCGVFSIFWENERMSIKRAWLCVISLHLYGADVIPYHFLKEIEDTAFNIPHLACFKVYLGVMTSWWINTVKSASTEHRACLHYALWLFVSLSCRVCLFNVDIGGTEVSSWYKSHSSITDPLECASLLLVLAFQNSSY